MHGGNAKLPAKLLLQVTFTDFSQIFNSQLIHTTLNIYNFVSPRKLEWKNEFIFTKSFSFGFFFWEEALKFA